MDALTTFFIGNARGLGTAGKILFPIPNRRLSKRLYRVCTPVLLAWGRDDRFLPPLYAAHWQERLAQSEFVMLDGAGHMLPYEQPVGLAREVGRFLSG